MRKRDLVPLSQVPIWQSCLTTCAHCGKREASVYPLTASELECSGCGLMFPAPDLPREQNGFALSRLRDDIAAAKRRSGE